ncbi:hypothetical protein JB92DRAFT_2955168, partial [Gautieria morchelliformis]
MQPSQSFMDNDWLNSSVLDEFGYDPPIGPLLAASSIDCDICGPNSTTDTVVNLDNGEAGGPQHISMQVAPITRAVDLKGLISTTKVSGITSYWCDYPTCSRRFKTRRQVITHLRHIHLEEKPFKCITWYVRLPLL